MQTKNTRIAIIGLPGMLIDILATAFASEAGVVVSLIEGDLERIEPHCYIDCDLIITSMDTHRLVCSASRDILIANPDLLILNLSENGDTGDLFGYRLVRESLGEMFPEKILEAVRNGMKQITYTLQ